MSEVVAQNSAHSRESAESALSPGSRKRYREQLQLEDASSANISKQLAQIALVAEERAMQGPEKTKRSRCVAAVSSKFRGLNVSKTSPRARAGAGRVGYRTAGSAGRRQAPRQIPSSRGEGLRGPAAGSSFGDAKTPREAVIPASTDAISVQKEHSHAKATESKSRGPAQELGGKTFAPAPPLKAGEKREYSINFLLQFRDRCKLPPACVKAAESFLPGLGNNPGAADGLASGLLPEPTHNRGYGRDTRNQQSGRSNQYGRNNQYNNLPPMELPKKTENAYDISKAQPQTHTEAMLKEARGLLNKLTLTNFEKLSGDIANLEVRGPADLKGLVGIIFDKALEESHFCSMYAQLCKALKDRLPEFQAAAPDTDLPPSVQSRSLRVTFKRCLLNKCQEEFERADRYDELTDSENQGLAPEEKLAKTRRVRVRMLGNIKFIGELFTQKILNEKIIHVCVKRLLDDTDEDTIECLCKLMATIGKLLDRPEAKEFMDFYFDKMRETGQLVGKQPGGSRLKFMLQDTADLRKNKWVPRRETAGPKTIDEIREEAAKEGIVAGPIPPPRGPAHMDQRGGGGQQRHGQGLRQERQGGGGTRGGEVRLQHSDRRGGYDDRAHGGHVRGGHGDGRGGGGSPPRTARESPPRAAGGSRGGGGGGDYRSERFAGGGADAAPKGFVISLSSNGDHRTIRSSDSSTRPRPPPAAAPAPRVQDVPEPPTVEEVRAVKKPSLSAEQMEKRIASTLEEYVELKDMSEVKATLEEMGSRESFWAVVSKALEMACDAPKHTESLKKLLSELKTSGTLNRTEIEEGYKYFMEFLEDSAIDIPASPKVAAEFVAHGLSSGTIAWAFLAEMSSSFWAETAFHVRFLALVFSALQEGPGGSQGASKSWREGGVTLAAFGIEEPQRFVQDNALADVVG